VKYTKTIANHILKGQKRRYSQLIIRISIASIAVGIAVMLLSTSIVRGFQKTIRDKVSGFGAHITISHFDLNQSYESTPILSNPSYLKTLRKNDKIKSVQPYATKAGIIKQKEIIDGIILKGIDSCYDLTFLKQSLIKGNVIGFDSSSTQSIMISKITATKLEISVGDKVSMYFIQDPPRMRSFKVIGIFETGLSQYDSKFAIVNIAQIQKLNNWNNGEIDGYEVVLHEFSSINHASQEVNEQIPYNQKATNIIESNPEIFDWINLFDINMYIIIGLMFIISTITVISTLLILILEQTNTIGILKAIGINNQSLAKIFIYVAGNIILKGMLIGNIIALTVSIIQQKTHIIPLNQDLYYMNAVPIHLSFLQYFIINLSVFSIASLLTAIPIYIITRKISTIQAIRYQ